MEEGATAPAAKKGGRLILILIPLVLVCLVVGVVGGIFLYNQLNGPEQAKSYLKQNEPIYTEVSGFVEDGLDTYKALFESSSGLLRDNAALGTNYTTQLDELKKQTELLIEKSMAAKASLGNGNNIVATLHTDLSSYYDKLNSFATEFKDGHVVFLLEALPIYKKMQDSSNKLPPVKSPKTAAEVDQNIQFYKEVALEFQSEMGEFSKLTTPSLASAATYKKEMGAMIQATYDFYTDAAKALDKLVESGKTKSVTMLDQAEQDYKNASSVFDKALKSYIAAIKVYKEEVRKGYRADFATLADLEKKIEAEFKAKGQELGI